MKDEEIKKYLDKITKTFEFKNTRTQALKNKKCVMCTNPNFEFKDKISEKEYKISGMCQTCQDSFFEC